ncbi:MAG: succinate dehydrogenase assembly factor 2 [Limimaricola sp.]|uniref:succinate dehydrogenase assembly factor 2 n=1 Tax=Limimaricola sp. TaxID=2211665 RepID=UPI001DB6B746|nr:succinate dehydrogenase assembly factor 2 [Limimaricola sp.]MBI1416388.1 succinate dehydrogenase assembly factor 2 [Limimaricola sp.]
MNEPRETRLKRLRMRAMRRGIKEMDLILPAFTATDLDDLDAAELDLFEALLAENDHDLYQWVSGAGVAPPEYAGLIGRIAARATGVVRPV